ncbi:MAG TPA: threonine ammonia-lyase [Tepidiformaceae bacterium]|nr:threonine ammonia-lyase [Tepidiformaceae bacterium]
MSTVTLQQVRDAAAIIAPNVRRTPLWPMALPGGRTVHLKLENLQVTGSFKARGAFNFMHGLDATAAHNGLVAMSAGNHAQGVALAARERGIPVTVVMPAAAPLAKVISARELGAKVILHGASLDEARAEATAIAGREGRIFVPPFDDDTIIAGQGTVGLEIVEQHPAVEEVLVPAGGGGLLAGGALAIKALRPGVRVVGVQAKAMDGIAESLAAGKAVRTGSSRTIADGVAVSGPSERTFELIQQYVDEVVTVSEEAIAHAVVLLMERAKVIAEGAGALGIAAIQAGVYKPVGETVAIVSGGNIDINLIGSVVRNGLVDAGRYQQLAIEVTDTPGQLALVASVIASAGGNILEVEHNREAPSLPIGVAMLELLLEVNGRQHFSEILAALREAGLRGVPGSEARLATTEARSAHER